MNYSSLPSEIWTDPMFEELTPETKYFLLYLLTNPHVQKCGCYLLPARIAAAESGYNPDTVVKLLDSLGEAGWIDHDSATREILILPWRMLNPGFFSQGSKVVSAIKKEAGKIRSGRLQEIVWSWLQKEGAPPVGDGSPIYPPSMGDPSLIDVPIQYNTQEQELHSTENDTNTTVVFRDMWDLIPEAARSRRLRELVIAAIAGSGAEVVKSNVAFALRYHTPKSKEGKPQSLGGFLCSAISRDYAHEERKQAESQRLVQKRKAEEAVAVQELEEKDRREHLARQAVYLGLPAEERAQFEASLPPPPQILDSPRLREWYFIDKYAEFQNTCISKRS